MLIKYYSLVLDKFSFELGVLVLKVGDVGTGLGSVLQWGFAFLVVINTTRGESPRIVDGFLRLL